MLVQFTGVQSVGAVASLGISFANNVSAGNLITSVVCSYLSTGAVTLSESDNLTNSYTQYKTGTSNQTPNRSRTSFFYSRQITGGACTVTVTPSASAFLTVGINEHYGYDTPNDGLYNSATSTTPNTGSMAVAQPNSLVVAGFQHEGATTTIVQGSGFSLLFNATNATNEPGGLEYKEGVNSAISADFTIGASALWSCVGAVFNPIVIEQKSFRFYNDDGTPTAAENTNITRTTPVLLRTGLSVSENPSPKIFKIRYREVGDPGWRDLGV